MEYIFTLPLKISVYKSKRTGKDTFFNLNLNQYRNASYFTLNTAKISFKEEVRNRLKSDISIIHFPIEINYKLYIGSKRLCDVSNICSIIDKFFCDALVELGILPDDNYTIISGISYSFGGIDKSNPRCEITIKEI